jgi:uncharacterized protein YgiM (DUF1202 family)
MNLIPKVLLAVAVLFGTAEIANAYPASARTAVNLRSGPGVGYRIIGSVPRFAVVDVRTCQPRWCQVNWRGRIGYVARVYLQVRPGQPQQPSPLPPPHNPYPPYNPPYDPGYPGNPPYDPGYPNDPYPPYNPPYDPGYPNNPYPPYDPGYPGGFVCDDNNTGWAIGRPANRANINRVRDDANARIARIIRPGQVYTQEYSDQRVNIEVDFRNIIVSVTCG